MKEKIPMRFFIITFIWSWVIWLPLILSGYGIIPIKKELLTLITMPVSVVAAFGPAVGALISLRTLNGKEAVVSYLKSFFDLKFGLKAWLLIFLVLGLSTFVSWIVPEFFGEPRLSMLLPSIFIFPLYWLIMVFFGGGQEEIGWRGYILPFMERRFGLFFGSLLLGIIWAFWHIPLWFIPGTGQTYMDFFGFLMLTTGYSFFFSLIMKLSGNRPLVGLIVHGTANAFIPVFPVLIMKLGVFQIRFWIWTSLTFFIGIVFLIINIHKSKGVNRLSSENFG